MARLDKLKCELEIIKSLVHINPMDKERAVAWYLTLIQAEELRENFLHVRAI